MPLLTNEYLNYYPELPQVLYHYCSVNTFVSVVKNSNLWLSDAEKTNDTTEMKCLFSKINEVIDQALTLYKSDYSRQVLLQAKDFAFRATENLLTKKAHIVKDIKSFLACFSEADDLLSQWRGYGNNGRGMAIGFNAELFRGFVNNSYFTLTKVIYDQEDTLKFLHTAIDEPIKYAIESSIDKETGQYNEEKLRMSIHLLIFSIWQEGFLYKNEAFREEREWRLFRKLQSYNYSDREGIDDHGFADYLEGFFISNEKNLGGFTRSPLKFRCTDDDMRVYFELGFEKCKKDIIKEIVIGPKCKIEPLDIKLLLAKNGYIEGIFSENIAIKKSKCPYI